jgi:hypothetical protein
MSKTQLKKHLLSLTKDQVIEQVLELYGNCKPAKEYLEYYLNPDEKRQFEKYKAIIVNEFYPNRNTFNPPLRFSVAKKAIADFKLRCKSCVKYAEPCGYGFSEEIGQLFFEYYG